MDQQSFISWIRQPASIIIIIALVIMFVMLADQKRQKSGEVADKAGKSTIVTPSLPANDVASLPDEITGNETLVAGGGELPRIVQTLGPSQGATQKPSDSQPGRLAAPDLGSLLGRLEEKVKAEPDNISNRLLLAQTYNELGLSDKALEEARIAVKQSPDHSRANLVMASILSKRKEERELNEAVVVLKNLRGKEDVKQYLVEMYLGDAWIRMGNHKGALESWKLALDGMPVSDNRRSKLEKSIADINKGDPGA